MGADIHLMIEYARWTNQDGTPYWDGFGGEFNPGRNYSIFGVLAGVRSDGQLFPAKGLPDDIGHDAVGMFRLRINDEYADHDGYTSLEKATSWARSGSEIHNGEDGKPQYVDHPDLHSHTWLTRDELAQCIAHYELVHVGEPLEAVWHAILAVMTTFEERKVQVRLLIAFDN